MSDHLHVEPPDDMEEATDETMRLVLEGCAPDDVSYALALRIEADRDRIMWLETEADPAGTIRENYRLTQDNKALQAKCEAEKARANDYFDGYVACARAAGLDLGDEPAARQQLAELKVSEWIAERIAELERIAEDPNGVINDLSEDVAALKQRLADAEAERDKLHALKCDIGLALGGTDERPFVVRIRENAKSLADAEALLVRLVDPRYIPDVLRARGETRAYLAARGK